MLARFQMPPNSMVKTGSRRCWTQRGHWKHTSTGSADFLSRGSYLEAVKTHSDVVRPYAGSDQVALSINPYHLGFSMWEKIVEQRGLDHARRIVREDDDFSFVRNYLDEELARELKL